MKYHIKYSGYSCVYIAILLLVLPIKWVLAAILAASFHEICHYIAILMTGNPVYMIAVSSYGATIETVPLTNGKEIICALAGPLGSILLFFCYPWFPRVALCAGIQGLFNLVPVYPLDGGRIFCGIMNIVYPSCAVTICKWTEYSFIFLMIVLMTWISFLLKLGLIPVLIFSILVSRGLLEKFLAKRGI